MRALVSILDPQLDPRHRSDTTVYTLTYIPGDHWRPGLLPCQPGLQPQLRHTKQVREVARKGFFSWALVGF